MIDMASKQIIPAVIKYSQKLAKTVLDVKAAGVEPVVQADLLSRVNSKFTEMKEALEVLQREEAAAFAMEDVESAGHSAIRMWWFARHGSAESACG